MPTPARCTWLLTTATLLALPAAAQPPKDARTGPQRALCQGAYADDLSVLSTKARELEARQGKWSLCIRTSAVYECPYYGKDGTLKKSRQRVAAHGTAFAYKSLGQDTLLATNQHVADWPAVTDADHPVDDVPQGCRRVSDSLRVVDNESDAFDKDDVVLQRVVSDPALDVTIVKARAALPLMPWKIGRSSALNERNAVQVRGFPLGAIQAVHTGKVVSAWDHDSDKDWDHDDFVIDALVSTGNSGSPVLAVSCKTGEFELVGVFHARYSRSAGLNVVVGIDQVQDLMHTLRRTPRPPSDAVQLDAQARAALIDHAGQVLEPFFPFGPLAASVRGRADGALVYTVLAREFPMQSAPIAVVEDLPPPPDSDDAFGRPGRVWLGGMAGLKAWRRGQMDAEAQSVLARVTDALRRDALAAFQWRAASRKPSRSREQWDAVARMEKSLRKVTAARAELTDLLAEVAERLGPQPGDPVVRPAAVQALPAPAAATAAQRD